MDKDTFNKFSARTIYTRGDYNEDTTFCRSLYSSLVYLHVEY